MVDPMKNDPTATGSGASAIPGLAILACLVTGLISVGYALYHEDSLALVAAAVAFGAVTIATLR